jgi:farnesyl-diphosphate farnesyltransferase
MKREHKELLTTLLENVSRSFYRTLRVLPASIRPQIGLAYLLARTTDTIADTGLVKVEQRLQALQALSARISGTSSERLDLGALAEHQGSPAERTLLKQVDAALGLLETLSPGDRDLVRQVLRVIASGQELDLRRFGAADVNHIVALGTAEELDDYTYRVAGCVGEFWTRMCRRHLFPKSTIDEEWLLGSGVRFGKGLQLVNILRDVPGDLRQGRCYLPAEQLAPLGLSPGDLLDARNETLLRPLYDSCLKLCELHLRAGWEYTNALPRTQVRVRLACAWPILFGLETVRLLQTVNALDPGIRRKITRAQVRKAMWRSVVWYPLPSRWRALAR